MARGSLGAGGSLSRFTGQGLRSTLLFPFFILWQKDTDPLGGDTHRFPGAALLQRVPTLQLGGEGWDVPHPHLGEEESI